MGTRRFFEALSVPLKKALGCLLLLSSVLGGCAEVQTAYYEKHEVKNLTVVFLDDQSIQKEWSAMTGRPAVNFGAMSGYDQSMNVRTVRGFYDFRTNTIYCRKMDFVVCGHELHHALIGRFHPDH